MRPSVFLPHNEPYLGHPTLVEFDQAIPPAMETNLRLAQSTFDRELSPVQTAATQLVSQAVSIALSIRELIRQGYLFSAALLLRPLIERVGTVEHLRSHPDAVSAWHSGWPREDQPRLHELLEAASLIEDSNPDDLKWFATTLHKLIHPDPAGGAWNMISREDGKPGFSPGKMLDDPSLCEFISLVACRFMQLAIHSAEKIFPLPEATA
jgi:hypothetical protein